MYQLLKNEKAISLIEIVATILIIGLIFISFFSLFVQSKKVGHASEQIMDATFIAQQSMEELYIVTQSKPLNEVVFYLMYDSDKSNVTSNYNAITNFMNFHIIYQHPINQSEIEISFQKKSNTPVNVNLYNVVISVLDDQQVKSKMENILSIIP